MFCELMGICFSCRRPTSNRLNNKISEHISASVTPLHVCLEESRRPELGLCNATTLRLQSEGGYSSRGTGKAETETELLQLGTSELKQNSANMANPIGNMKMTNPIKGLVSKRRKRFTEDGFDLDLTYITTRLIAMGFPAEKLEGVYRNHIDDVVRLLELKHPDHYKIYNLCTERSYDCKKFKDRVAIYAFDDHNPPKMEIIKPFCEDVDSWLTEHDRNVAAIHCKAGKGRTGVMVCCYLLHTKYCKTATEALNFYGTSRTTDKKGVTIPSQRRYVNYYSTLIQENLNYQPVILTLREIKLDPLPILNGCQGYHFVISEANNKIFSSDNIEVRKGITSLSIPLPPNVQIKGDIRIDFYHSPRVKRKQGKLFHFWFNTFFVRDQPDPECDNGGPIERTTRALSCDGTAMELPMVHARPRTGSLASLAPTSPDLVLTFDKWGLDGAHKDKNHKVYHANFKVSLYMHRVGNSLTIPAVSPPLVGRPADGIQLGVDGQETPTESSEADSSECSTTGDEDGWESGESSSASLVVNRHSSSSHDTIHDSPTNSHESIAVTDDANPDDSDRDGNNGKADPLGGNERNSGSFDPSPQDT